MTPTSVSSRFSARPVMPWPKSSISLSMTSAKPFDLGHAVADLADDADALLGSRGFGASDLRFDFLHQVSHSVTHSTGRHSRASSAARRARTLSSYTSLPTLIRIPPMSAGFSAKVASSPGPYTAREASLDVFPHARAPAAWRSRRGPYAGRYRVAPAAGSPTGWPARRGVWTRRCAAPPGAHGLRPARHRRDRVETAVAPHA